MDTDNSPAEARGAAASDGVQPAPSPEAAPEQTAWAALIRRAAFAAVLLLAGAGLLLAGAFWHEPIRAWFGSGRATTRTEAQEGQGVSGARQLWTCGMHPQVIQNHPGTCPICHMKLTPLHVEDAGAEPAKSASGQRKAKYWWDPMLGPASISDKPGKSAMGMDLVPVYEDEVSAGPAVTIDPVVVQNMGVRFAQVERGPLRRTVRAVGSLREAQPNIHDVNLRVSGWIDKLYADTEGMHVEAGAKLFDLYSPEVQVAVQELIAARRNADKAPAGGDELPGKTARTLYRATARKLELWGLAPEEVERLAGLDQAPRTVTFTSPIKGHVTDKPVVEGAAAKAGDRVLRIVDHSTLWLDAQVYEQDLPFIKLGQKTVASVESLPGRPLEGEVVFIHPHLDAATRTATARVVVHNPALDLRPGMYATVQIESELASDALLVPREAVIDTGTRQIVFVAAGGGRFEPREITPGISASGTVQVLKGLAPGETVVTSGQFLLDAESRMKEAIQKHLGQRRVAEPGAARG